VNRPREKFDTDQFAFQIFHRALNGRGKFRSSRTRERPKTVAGQPRSFVILFSNHNESSNNMAKTQNAKKQAKKAPLKSAKQKKQAKSAKKAR
jgi:hypothetical protein